MKKTTISTLFLTLFSLALCAQENSYIQTVKPMNSESQTETPLDTVDYKTPQNSSEFLDIMKLFGNVDELKSNLLQQMNTMLNDENVTKSIENMGEKFESMVKSIMGEESDLAKNFDFKKEFSKVNSMIDSLSKNEKKNIDIK